MRGGPLTDSLWRQIEPIFEAIRVHPFIRELSQGSLRQDRFAFYIQQDALYLQDFARALGLAGVRSVDPQTVQDFLDFGSVAISVERQLHESFFQEFRIGGAATQSPACFMYTRHLLASAAVGAYPEVVGALLPCFWIYREVGNHVLIQASASLASNPYRRWIETYSSKEYAAAVDRAIDIAERVGAESTSSDWNRMSSAFETSARLEWMFWDSAYRLETWPP
jgi:thiaminase/transcriptional activator TenA